MKLRNNRFLIVAILVFIGSALFSQSRKDDVLMTIAGDNVTQSEFLHVYLKNNVNNDVIDKKSLEDYLELYINFKLKVKEAEELGMDTIKAYIDELNGYRSQLAQPYLIDEEVTEKMLLEAYERMFYDVRASHILIRVGEDAIPEDTLAAYNKITDIREMIMAGSDFGEMAVEYSEDPSAKDRPATGRRPYTKGNRGDLGYFTVFDMVYPFESGAYTTQVSYVSEPIRTSYGYHLIKTTEKKEAMGQVQVAHILIMVPQNASHEDSLLAEEKINLAYEEIMNGEDYAAVVKKYSDDKGTVEKGGVLPWFGVNRMIPEFIVRISELEKLGDLTEPFVTIYGWHIVKLLDQKEIGSYEENSQNLKQKIAKSDRARQSTVSFIANLKKEYKFKEYPQNLKPLYGVISDTAIFKGRWDVNSAKDLIDPLFELDGQTYSQWDLAKYIADKQSSGLKESIEIYVNKKYKTWMEETIISYENSRLETKYPEFKALLKEYRDGILLFELTDEKIWSKAISDTSGLKTFYENNKKNYMWTERVDATIYMVENVEYLKKILKLAKKDVPKNDILNQINHDSLIYVRIVRDEYELGDNEIIDAQEWIPGITDTFNHEGETVFIQIHEVMAPQPKLLSETRGIITADYQNYLEEQWIKELRAKYKVVVNKEVLNSIE